MVWLPDGEKILKICLFILTECTNVTDTQTDRQTDTSHDSIDRACIALRGKNHDIGPISHSVWEIIQDRVIVTIEGE